MFHFAMHLCSFALHSKNVCKYKYIYLIPISRQLIQLMIPSITNDKDAANSFEVNIDDYRAPLDFCVILSP